MVFVFHPQFYYFIGWSCPGSDICVVSGEVGVVVCGVVYGLVCGVVREFRRTRLE